MKPLYSICRYSSSSIFRFEQVPVVILRFRLPEHGGTAFVFFPTLSFLRDMSVASGGQPIHPSLQIGASHLGITADWIMTTSNPTPQILSSRQTQRHRLFSPPMPSCYRQLKSKAPWLQNIQTDKRIWVKSNPRFPGSNGLKSAINITGARLLESLDTSKSLPAASTWALALTPTSSQNARVAYCRGGSEHGRRSRVIPVPMCIFTNPNTVDTTSTQPLLYDQQRERRIIIQRA